MCRVTGAQDMQAILEGASNSYIYFSSKKCQRTNPPQEFKRREKRKEENQWISHRLE